MVNSFNRLWHNTIISSYNKNGNISYRSAACPHTCEGCMSGCIKESNFLSTFFNLIGPNMLGNSSSFTCRYTGITQCIKQCCLTMVDMPHNRYNGRTFNHIFRIKIIIFNEETFNISCINFHFLMCFNAIINH